jgi:hypothetical protein
MDAAGGAAAEASSAKTTSSILPISNPAGRAAAVEAGGEGDLAPIGGRAGPSLDEPREPDADLARDGVVPLLLPPLPLPVACAVEYNATPIRTCAVEYNAAPIRTCAVEYNAAPIRTCAVEYNATPIRTCAVEYNATPIRTCTIVARNHILKHALF